MRLPLLLCMTSLAATTALAQRESSPSSSPSSQPGASSQSGQSTKSSDTTLSATGRETGYSGQQHFRSTKIIGAQVKTSSGEDVGRIEDVVLNPTSGRIDFAVISAESKLCPVPWQLLSVSGQGAQGSQASSTSSSATSTATPSSPATPGSPTSPQASAGVYASSSASMGQPAFTLNVEKSKLQQGPSFDRSRWPEMSATWSQKIYTHYGVQAETGVGGTGAGSSKSSTSSQSDQGSTGSATDSSSGKSDKSSDKSSSGSKK